MIADRDDERLPPIARTCLDGLAGRFLSLHEEITVAEKRIQAWHRSSEVSQRLETIPGIGPITASALAASITDPALFRSGREMAAWIGLVPRQNSTGGKERMGRISKMGERTLRRLLVSGMTSQLQSVRRNPDAHPWVTSLLRKKPPKLVAVAMANKAARIAWVVMTRGESYRTPQPTPKAAA